MSRSIEKEINEKICQAWNNLDANILAPYLSDDLVYDCYYVDKQMTSKKEYLEYLTGKFETLSKHPEINVKASVEDENGTLKAVLHQSDMPAVYDVVIEDDKITKMYLRPYSRFCFENFDNDFPQLISIAGQTLDTYFHTLKSKQWTWLQTSTPEIRFQDLCIAYDKYVLSIIIGLYRKTMDTGEQIFVNQQEYQNLMRECENNNLTPCIFLIDPLGKPLNDGCNLLDAKTLSPVNLDNLSNDNGSKMSDWEINNLGIAYACDFLINKGYTNVCYSDVLTIEPQIFFNYNGQQAYAIVRTVPAGLSDSKKVINRKLLDGLSEMKGFFIDIRIAALTGGSGMYDDKYLYRGILYPVRYESNGNPVYNIAHNEIELIDIEKAIKDFDFIEVKDDELYSV